jgi:uncharacterized protein (DUF427 family)
VTESVWDYPRPPRLETSPLEVVIEFGGAEIVRTRRSLRVLETSHPPVHYVPIDDVRPGVLRAAGGGSYCEWKGVAAYFDVVAPEAPDETAPDRRIVRPRAAWHYPAPTSDYPAIRGHVAFYPSAMDRCLLDGEQVTAQEGDFYGGWITSRIVGPFKGAPGTRGW